MPNSQLGGTASRSLSALTVAVENAVEAIFAAQPGLPDSKATTIAVTSTGGTIRARLTRLERKQTEQLLVVNSLVATAEGHG